MDKNLNELINTGLEIISPLYDLYLNYPTELTSLASFIPAIFIYKSIVNLYANYIIYLILFKSNFFKIIN